MKTETVDSEEIPSLRMDEEELMKRGDPVAYLKAFGRISRRKDRYRIGFDRQTLGWVARMWNEAAVASLRDDDICRESERYMRLWRELEAGIHEFNTDGVVYLNHPSDWPTARTIQKAINAFVHAQINVIR